MKKAFLIHGWDGYPENSWFPWLKQELKQKGFEVQVPAMPHPDEPKIEEWIPALSEIVGEPNGELYFIGHSVGCQAVLRYIETLSSAIKIKCVILVAPWMELDVTTLEEEGEGIREIAEPWMETPINFQKVKNQTEKIVAIFSDNDPYVALSQREIFKNKLNADIITEHEKGHFDDFEGMKELPSVLDVILKN